MSNINPYDIDLYHIVHVDKLHSILGMGGLLCDMEVHNQDFQGTTIGMDKIKKRRMVELNLRSYPDLFVGNCVPFYFCPRSVMLYIFSKKNHPEISYLEGQEPIVHLVFRMMDVITWAEQQGNRWVFTDSNAGSYYFEDYSSLSNLDQLNWNAINTDYWSNCKEQKQAEFLVEKFVPWQLVKGIGVYSLDYFDKVHDIIDSRTFIPPIAVKREWYYLRGDRE